jgi:hypothetical protein
MTKEKMEGFWFSRLRHGGEIPEDSHWAENKVAEWLEKGLLEYDPQRDALRWIGPRDEEGRPTDPLARLL